MCKTNCEDLNVNTAFVFISFSIYKLVLIIITNTYHLHHFCKSVNCRCSIVFFVNMRLHPAAVEEVDYTTAMEIINRQSIDTPAIPGCQTLNFHDIGSEFVKRNKYF